MTSLELFTGTPLDKHGYLFGKKIKNSLSPELHAVIYQELGLRWAQHRLDSDDIAKFLQLIKHPDFFGASVTMPNKVAIMPHLDYLTDECRSVGACNTIFIREEGGNKLICGTNTDIIGVRDAFYNNIPDPEAAFFHGRPGLIVGGGGAARSAVYALRRYMRCKDIYLINRYSSEVEAMIHWCAAHGHDDGIVYVTSVEQAAGLPAPGAVVACIPDFPPQTPEEVLVRRIFEAMLQKEEKGSVLEMCYNPKPWTEIACIAEREGWNVILGTEAMIWQGIEQDKYWTGKKAHELPVQKVRDMVASKLPQQPKKLPFP